jgi:hypothetical protein
MVMSTEPQQNDENIQIIDPVEPDLADTDVAEEPNPPADAPDDAPQEAVEAPVDGPSVAETSAAPETSPTSPQAPPPIDQKTIDELHERRTADQQREWKERVGRQARTYEQQLEESGYMPEQARDQARRYVAQEQKFRKQEQDSAEMLGYVQGKQAAAIHYMKQHGLANKQMLDDFTALQAANSPADMEKEAQRMKRERSLVAENARLKQGRVAPQTFDNSQGSAEVTTNQDRLLDAYIRGDRSEAAMKAAQRLAMGN